MQTLIIKNGILKQVSTETELKELEKNNWDYRLITASGQFCVIDYDKDEARPYVKSLLAKVNKLREVKLLYGTIAILIFSFLAVIAFGVITLIEIGNVKKIIGAIPKTEVAQVKKLEPIKVDLSESIDKVDMQDKLQRNTASGAVNSIKFGK